MVYIGPQFEYGPASDMLSSSDPWRLRALAPFRGPERTLFVFDRERNALFVCGWDGSEIHLPIADLAAFLDYCLAHRRSGGSTDPGK